MLFSCGPSSNEVVLSESDYKKLIGDTIKPEYPKKVGIFNPSDFDAPVIRYYLGDDGHEYQEHVENGQRNQWTHYAGCKKCQKERDDMNHKLDSILILLDTTKTK